MSIFQEQNTVTEELTAVMARLTELANHESVTDRERGAIVGAVKSDLRIPGLIWLPEDWEEYVPDWVAEGKREAFMHEAWSRAAARGWDCTESDWARVEMYAMDVAEKWRASESNGELLSEDEFDERFTTVADDEGQVLRPAVPEDVEHGSRHLWTVVEGDSGLTYVVAGWHYVNRVGYVLTEEEWEDAATTAVWG